MKPIWLTMLCDVMHALIMMAILSHYFTSYIDLVQIIVAWIGSRHKHSLTTHHPLIVKRKPCAVETNKGYQGGEHVKK